MPTTEKTPASALTPSLLVPIYIVLIMAGHVLFQSGFATLRGNELSRHQALFTAVNAATLTGFQQSRNVNEYTTIGQAAILMLILGGVLFSFLAGGAAVIRIARLKYSEGQLLGWSVGALCITAAVGTISSFIAGDPLFNSVITTLSAFGNSGLFLGQLPTIEAPRTILVLLPLSVLGGLGLPVLMELLDSARGKIRLSAHSQTVLLWSAGVFIAGAMLLMVLRWPGQDASAQLWGHAWLKACVQSLNARSAGFSFEFATYWPRVVQWSILGLMLVGGGPAGTAGGLKVTTFATLFRNGWASLHGGFVSRPLGIALVWVGLYLTMIGTTLLALLTTEPQIGADRILFLSVSALGNVGLSHDPVTVSDGGLYILSATMLAGRIAPVMILWWMAETMTEPSVAIG